MFDNGFEFKQVFTPFLEDFYIRHVLMTIKNRQDSAPLEQVHQLILNILATKDLDNKLFDHIDPWDETLVYTAWAIRPRITKL